MEDSTLMLPKLFSELEREGVLTKLFLEFSITLILKPDKDPTKEENYLKHFNVYRYKKSQ